MNDVWFDAGLTRRDVETILRVLSLREDRPQPLFAVADRGGRLVLASRALFRFFDVPDAGALAARLLAGRDPGARRLASLAQGLAINGAPRLERLRFAVRGRPEVVTFLCRRISLDGHAPLLVAAALGLGERGAAVPQAAAAPGAALAAPGDAPAAPEGAPAASEGAPAASQGAPASLPDGLPARADLARPLVGQALARSLDEAKRAEAGGAAENSVGAKEDEAPGPAGGPAAAPDTGETPAVSSLAVPSPAVPPRGPLDVAEALRAGSAPRRFSWQTDAALACTRVGPALAEAVGAGNADLVGRDMAAVARRLDPGGRFAALLAQRATFDGVALAWPVAGAAAAVTVELGGSPTLARDGGFDGFRGYGVIRPGEVVAHEPASLDGPLPSPEVAVEAIAPPAGAGQPPAADPPLPAEAPEPSPASGEPAASGNVVAFPGTLSARDREVFDALGSELRDRVGPEPTPATEPQGAAPIDMPAAQTPPAADGSADAVPEAAPAADRSGGPKAPSAQALRAAEAARNGLAVLDRLHVALLVSRSNVPIFANRHLLDLTGFVDEDELHEAGGLKHLFGGVPGNGSGGEVVGVRARDGSVAFTTARMQQIEWDGLPATLLTLKEGPPPAAAQPPSSSPAEPPSGYGVVDGGEVRALRAILDSASDGVLVLDAECRILSLNRSGEALIGRDRREVMGKPFLDLVAPEARAAAAAYLGELRQGAVQGAAMGALNGGRELRLATGQGRSLPAMVTLGRLGNGEEVADAPRYCALFRDVRPPSVDARPTEAAGPSGAGGIDALNGVAREVRLPLAAIAEAGDQLAAERYGALGHPRYREHVGDIRAAAGEIDGLLRDLLALSQAQAGRLALAAEPVDVNRIVGEAVSAAQPRASRERVIMRLSLAPGLPAVQADAETLRRIVGNILGNALAFNEPGGQVIVASAPGEDGGVAIRVRDTGPGLSEGEVAAALRPFGRGEGTAATRPAGGGSSLALPLAKALAEASGATLAIRSRLEQGTMIELLFPRERVAAGSGAA